MKKETLHLINNAKGLFGREHDVVNNLQNLFSSKEGKETSKKSLDLLWEDMYHQGEVSEVAFYVAPMLIDYMLENKILEMEILSYVTSIEFHRMDNNIDLPYEAINQYDESFSRLWNNINYFLEKECDLDMCIAVVSLIAIKNKQTDIISMILQ